MIGSSRFIAKFPDVSAVSRKYESCYSAQMKLLAEITEQGLGIEPAGEILGKNFRLRKSARGVVLNDKNEVSMQFVGKHNYYKLPGGGVDAGETIEEALRRELIEEVGCNIVIEHELGITIEYRTQHNLLHISYGFIARVDGALGEPSYEQGEIDDEFKPVWMPLEKAIEVTSTMPSAPYKAAFMVTRENIFLLEAARILKG
jgi:ADP-ribose pyrophosphatase YjhB (NUDIX family)